MAADEEGEDGNLPPLGLMALKIIGDARRRRLEIRAARRMPQTSAAEENPPDVEWIDPYRDLWSSPAVIGEQRSITIDRTKEWFLRVFDPAEAVRVYQDRHGEAPESPSTRSFGGQAGDQLLRVMAHDPMRGWRRLPVASAETIAALDQLGATMPNFREPLETIRLACRASLATGLPWQLPVMILDGQPGTGKTRFSKAVAAILGTSIAEIAMPQMNGAGPLSGTDQTWRNPKIGKVAQALVASETAAPSILLDELEKTFSYAGDNPLDVLHTLWESENACRFTDECLGCQFAAHRVTWFATTNETRGIRESLLDRAQVFSITPPDQSQIESVINAIYRDLADEWHEWFTTEVDADVVTRIRAISPRQIKAVLRAAMVRAAADGRKSLSSGDIRVTSRSTAKRMGFIS